MSDKRRVVVGRADEIPPGTMRLIPEGRFGIGVYNVNGEFRALNNYCPHAGAPVCAGDVTSTAVSCGDYRIRLERRNEILQCPWHGWAFDIGTGASLTKPVRKIKTYSVIVEDGAVILELSPLAKAAPEEPLATGGGRLRWQ